MNTIESKVITIKYIDKFMTYNGFKLMKNSSSEAIYKRKTILGYDIFGSSPTNYNPLQMLGFGVSKIIKPIEDVTKEINKHVQLNPPIHSNTRSLALLNYKLDRGKESARMSKPETTEEDVKEYAEEVMEYLKTSALPLLDKFNDLREIDKVINGDDFWITDWQKPFNLGGNFYVKRLIIAKLAGGQKHLEEVIEKDKLAFIESEKEQGRVANLGVYEDMNNAVGFTVNYLKNVGPLYD